jgi:hypothetical protein
VRKTGIMCDAKATDGTTIGSGQTSMLQASWMVYAVQFSRTAESCQVSAESRRTTIYYRICIQREYGVDVAMVRHRYARLLMVMMDATGFQWQNLTPHIEARPGMPDAARCPAESYQ